MLQFIFHRFYVLKYSIHIPYLDMFTTSLWDDSFEFNEYYFLVPLESLFRLSFVVYLNGIGCNKAINQINNLNVIGDSLVSHVFSAWSKQRRIRSSLSRRNITTGGNNIPTQMCVCEPRKSLPFLSSLQSRRSIFQPQHIHLPRCNERCWNWDCEEIGHAESM